MKNKIRFYLEGGGAKCTYQLTFLKHLFNNNNFNNNFELESIWAISFGSVMAYLFLLDEVDLAKKLLEQGDNILIKSFDLSKYTFFINKIPFIGKYFETLGNAIWIMNSLKEHGLFKPDNIEKYLQYALMKNKNNIHKLYKLNVMVYNITKNKSQVINGDHPLIIDYILAGMSVWLLFPPRKIKLLKSECDCNINCDCRSNNNDIYCNCSNEFHKYNDFIDIGFMHTIPFDNISQDISNNLINCYLLTNPINNTVNLSKGNNLLEYMYNIIDTVSSKYQNFITDKINFINNNKITHIITNNSNLNISEINKYKINKNFKKGIIISKKYLRYLNSKNFSNNKIFKYDHNI